MKKQISLGVLALTISLAACGGSSNTSTSSSVVEATDDSTFNEADVMFAQMMIPHHEQAIEMSDIALDPSVGASGAIRDLATRIKAAQDPEIATMKSYLEAWEQPMSPEDGMDHGSMMEGMLSVEELDELATLTGPAFDARWAEAMIAHHKGAVAMATDVLADGTNPDTKDLATSIVATQQGEIDELTPIANP
jgi:uncharacterized protein (DUF305 family)